ncbi:MAG: hypothetical protein K2G20_02505, partial [Lachnospiraceae bacterium]|nr:hypothetical protein [Lachnospiraceae bacterium]
MVHTISEIIIIVLLAILGLFHSKAPVFLIMTAAALIILMTYQSVCEEKEKSIMIAVLVFMAVFAILSGDFSGFLVFFFLKDVKVPVRICMGTLLFIFVQLMIYQSMPIAMCM